MKSTIKNRIVTIIAGFTVAGASLLGTTIPASAKVGEVVNPLTSKSYNYGSEYGARCIPVLKASANHPGQDFAAADGTTIKSIANGTVYKIVQPSGSSVSGKVIVKYVIDKQTYYVAYLHMWKPSQYVKVGQTVKKGQTIAEVGSSGPSTGPHLHFEVWKNAYKTGTTVNPTTFMKSQGVDLKADASKVTAKVQPSTCTYYATANTSLKSSASSSAKTLATVSKGAKMTNKRSTSVTSGSYVQVTTGGKTGWVHKNYVNPKYVAPAKTTTKTSTTSYSNITANVTYKTNNSVNFRKGPSTSYSVIKKLSKNTTAKTTGRASGSWYEIKVGSTTGWVHKNYLTKSTTTSTVKTKTVKSNVNYRSGASTKYKSYGVIKKNTKVVITGKTSKGWYQVKHNGKTGWVDGNYLK